MCTEYDARLHYPFIGLVREGSLTSSFEAAAVLTKPAALTANAFDPDSFMTAFKTYYTALLSKLTSATLPTSNTGRLTFILSILTEKSEIVKSLALPDLNEANKVYYSCVLASSEWAADIC